MVPIIAEKRSELEELCRRYYVRQLAIFGSGSRESTSSKVGDLDFWVDFLPCFHLERI